MNEIQTEHVIVSAVDTLPSLDAVLNQLGQGMQDPHLLERVESYYKKDAEWVRNCASPCYGIVPAVIDEQTQKLSGLPAGTQVFLVLLTMGECEMRTQELFDSNEPVHALTFDALLNAWLFQMDVAAQERIHELCGQLQCGVVDRLESGNELPLEMQDWMIARAPEELKLQINSSHQLAPIKSMAYLCVLTKDSKVFRTQHDCSRCHNRNCAKKKQQDLFVYVQNEGKKLSAGAGDNLLQLLREADSRILAGCNGIGTCGKCKIQVLSGQLPVTDTDRRMLTQKELENGVRLACAARLKETIRIRILDRAHAMRALTEPVEVKAKEKVTEYTGAWAVAVDIGTTTIAASLFGLEDHKVYATHARVNSGGKYGADVLSRIQAAEKPKQREELQALLKEDLLALVTELFAQIGQTTDRLLRVAVAANMTMVHLLLGYPCESLGRAPFQPYARGPFEMTGEFLGLSEQVTIQILPAISAFIGGDITAGMLALDFDRKNKPVLFIDFGTNAEMVLVNGQTCLAASAAAGPAFEGVGLSCGCGSIAGAIESVRLSENQTHIETIGHQTPVGLCGSGAIETLSELLRTGVVDETGEMQDAYKDHGFSLCQGRHGQMISITQADVRQLQLALAAIRAGADTLLHAAGLREQDLERIYLAGGFGTHLSSEAAIGVGLFVPESKTRLEAVGNTALLGAKRYLLEKDAPERINRMTGQTQEIVLAGDAGFQNRFMQAMNLKREE